MKITILTDKTSWMNKYNLILQDKIRNFGYDVDIVNSKKELSKGDIAFFLSCFEIIGNEYLILNKHNIVVHASNLPQGKGWSPASWQILEGKNDIPLTLFEATKSVDAGNWYIKDTLHLNGYELIDEWREKLGKKIVEMCINYIEQYTKIKGVPQSGDEFFYPRRKPKDSELDINKTLKEQFNLLRIVDNKQYPAFFELDNHKYKLIIEHIN